jgi:hypothetical protein
MMTSLLDNILSLELKTSPAHPEIYCIRQGLTQILVQLIRNDDTAAGIHPCMIPHPV